MSDSDDDVLFDNLGLITVEELGDSLRREVILTWLEQMEIPACR